MRLSIVPFSLFSLWTVSTLAFQSSSHPHGRVPSRSSTASVLHAGFGNAPSKAPAKLKPKAQWNRYLAMPSDVKGVTVGVKANDNDEWLTVGTVKSKGADGTAAADAALVRQRALIVEHAKRLHPTKIKTKTVVEWGYRVEDDWTMVDPKQVTIPDGGFEKTIGFQGLPDPATGFYCIYNEGRLVEKAANIHPSARY